MPLPAAPTPSTVVSTSVTTETLVWTAPLMDQPAMDSSALAMAPHDAPKSCPIDVPLLSSEDAFLRVDPVTELILSIPSMPITPDATSTTPATLAMPVPPLEPKMFVDIEQGLPACATTILTPTPPAEVMLLIPSLPGSPPAHASPSGPAFSWPASTAHDDVRGGSADVEAYGITSPTARSTGYNLYDTGDMGMCEQASGILQDASTEADLWTKGAYVNALLSWPYVVSEESPRGRCDEDQACCATLAEIIFPSLSSKPTAEAILSEPTADHTSTTPASSMVDLPSLDSASTTQHHHGAPVLLLLAPPALKVEASNDMDTTRDSAPLSSVVDMSSCYAPPEDEHRDDAATRAPLLLLPAPPALKPEACGDLDSTLFATVQPVVDGSRHDAPPSSDGHAGDDAPPAPVLLLQPAPQSIDPEAASDADSAPVPAVSEGMSMDTAGLDGQGMEQQREGGSAEPSTVEAAELAFRSVGSGDEGLNREISLQEADGSARSKGLRRLWGTIVHGARTLAEGASATVQGLETADREWKDVRRARMEAFLEDALGFE